MKSNSTRNRPVVVHRADVIRPLQWMYWRYPGDTEVMSNWLTDHLEACVG